jgi:hypothetical protein
MSNIAGSHRDVVCIEFNMIHPTAIVELGLNDHLSSLMQKRKSAMPYAEHQELKADIIDQCKKTMKTEAGPIVCKRAAQIVQDYVNKLKKCGKVIYQDTDSVFFIPTGKEAENNNFFLDQVPRPYIAVKDCVYAEFGISNDQMMLVDKNGNLKTRKL